ncbi:MAG: iron ABC transporter permease [Verrucomicrobia bacterium]|jgi:iron complex transport system permease protein|nr:iron ABC transporter permease [Verrucomicrobiota bacterium]
MRGRQLTLWLVIGAVPVVGLLCLLFGASGLGVPDLNDQMGRAIFGLRMNRVLTAFVVGAALSCAGCVFQALLRNPLAEPYVLGVSSGAALGAAGAILLGAGSGLMLAALPCAAFLGAGVTMGLVLLVAGGVGASIYSLILSGVIVSAIASSVLMFLVATASSEGLHSVVWWMLGNLQPTSSGLLATCAAIVAVGIAGVWWLASDLNTLTLGRDTAHHVGVRTRFATLMGLLLATLVTSAAVAVAGLISFVGLIVPHAVRSIIGPDHRRLIPVSALAGGAFLAVCDAVARTVLPVLSGQPIEIPVGVLTALCGGPFFLFILKFRGRRGWIG